MRCERDRRMKYLVWHLGEKLINTANLSFFSRRGWKLRDYLCLSRVRMCRGSENICRTPLTILYSSIACPQFIGSRRHFAHIWAGMQWRKAEIETWTRRFSPDDDELLPNETSILSPRHPDGDFSLTLEKLTQNTRQFWPVQSPRFRLTSGSKKCTESLWFLQPNYFSLLGMVCSDESRWLGF